MIIREFKPGDTRAVRDLLVAAFPTAAEADLVEQLRADGHGAIELISEGHGGVTGHILFSPMEAPFSALALAPVAVTPGRQGVGVGTALIEAGHELAVDRGWDAVFVLGEPAYYGRFGYSAEAAARFESPYAGPYFLILPLAQLTSASGLLRHARAFAALG